LCRPEGSVEIFNFRRNSPILDPMSAHGPWRPLGVLLVEKGVISEAELDTALADQAASEKPLGEILIAHGFSSRPAIQDALAEQAGVLFEPERGFGTGLRGLLARKHKQRKETDLPVRPQLAVVPPVEEAETEAPPQRVAAAVVASAETSAPQVNVLRPVEQPQLAPTPAPPPRASAPQPVKPSVEVQIEELRTAQKRTSGELARIAEALARVQAQLAELRAAPQAAPVRPAPKPRPEPEPVREPELPPAAKKPTVELAHLRFVVADALYRLETHEGPAPALGDAVEIDERPFRVVKVARSPLPGDERRCAYLLGD
jgi:hypothetical protein